jgi:hypothetical protein
MASISVVCYPLHGDNTGWNPVGDATSVAVRARVAAESFTTCVMDL